MEKVVEDREGIRAAFFPPLDFADLWLEVTPALLHWRFTFMDLGMCHTLERSFRYRIKGGSILVGRTRARDRQHLLAMIFDHFPRYRRRLDRHLKLTR